MQCAAAVEQARWPSGFRCPQCGNSSHCVLPAESGLRKTSQCQACRHQTSLIAGTLFQSTHLPLTLRFLEISLISEVKTGLSSLALKRALGVSGPHRLADASQTHASDGRARNSLHAREPGKGRRHHFRRRTFRRQGGAGFGKQGALCRRGLSRRSWPSFAHHVDGGSRIYAQGDCGLEGQIRSRSKRFGSHLDHPQHPESRRRSRNSMGLGGA